MVSFRPHLAGLARAFRSVAKPQSVLECGGKQSATPLRFATARHKICAGAAGLCALGAGVQASDAGPLLDRWLNSQTNIQSWSADVVQTRALKALTQSLSATGHVWFVAPNLFHWELGSPPQTIAVRQSEQMFIIYPRLKRAEKYPLTERQPGQWRDTLALLDAGFPRSREELQSRFRILSESDSNGLHEAALQPKSASARRLMPQIRIVFATNDFSLRATELQFADGSTLRNDFIHAVVNRPVDESLFAPKLDGDFKIVEPLGKPTGSSSK